MKRTVFALLVLALLSLPVQAIQIRSVEDVLTMHRAGVSADLLLAIVRTPHEAFEVTAEDVVALKDAGVSQEVINALVATAAANGEPLDPEPIPEPVVDDDPAIVATWDWCLVFDPPLPIYWPDYAFIPRWIWDPHWFMPRLDGGIGKRANGDGSSRVAGRTQSAAAERAKRDLLSLAKFAALLKR